ncbi:hypothetical protein C8R47DRAFT_646890 [Mycena vitilis]|nr:hypothetical protein C8R47DRAFT_646890 [Mycena vitilis]
MASRSVQVLTSDAICSWTADAPVLAPFPSPPPAANPVPLRERCGHSEGLGRCGKREGCIKKSCSNSHGLSPLYRQKPTAIPDMEVTLQDRATAGLKALSSKIIFRLALVDIVWLYLILSSWLFGRGCNLWNDGANTSKISRNEPFDIVLSDAVHEENLRGINLDQLDKTANTSEMKCEGNGWKTWTVTIRIPIAQTAAKSTRRAKATARRHDQLDPDPSFITAASSTSCA